MRDSFRSVAVSVADIKPGLITYGDVSRSQLESDSITVSDPVPSKDSANQIVQLIDNQNRLSFAPLEQCRSFFVCPSQIHKKHALIGHRSCKVLYDTMPKAWITTCSTPQLCD